MFKAIKWLFIFLYHFFFIDQATGHQSNTKFFANVGYIALCYLFPYAVIYGSKASFDLWLVFGAVVVGNRTMNVMLQNKAGVPSTGDASWKAALQGAQSPVDGDSDDKPDPAPASTTVTVTTTAPAPTPSGPNIPKTDDLVN